MLRYVAPPGEGEALPPHEDQEETPPQGLLAPTSRSQDVRPPPQATEQRGSAEAELGMVGPWYEEDPGLEAEDVARPDEEEASAAKLHLEA